MILIYIICQLIQNKNYDLLLLQKLLFIKNIIMLDSLFEKRNMRPTNEMYYFQLVPTLLTIKNPALARNLKASNSEFRLKITKGNQLSDEMKKTIAVKAINGKAAFDKVGLNFNLTSFVPNRNVQFTLVLLKSQETGQEIEAGSYPILSTNYILQFKNNKTKFFSQSVNIGSDYALTFDLYVDNSRFSLQKFIKQTKDQQKEGKIQNMLDVSKKSSSNNPTLNQAKSQIRSDSQKVQVVMSGEGRFISPTRKIVRKQSQTRRVLKKGSSPQRSQDGSSSKKDLKFLSRNSQQAPIIQKTQSLAEKQAKKLSEKIRQQQQKQKLQAQKRQRAKKQKEAELERRKNQAQKMEQQRIDLQKKREEEEAARKAEQLRQIAQQKRLQNLKKRQEQRKQQQQRKQNARKAAEKKRQQSIRKNQQEQLRRNQQQQLKRAQAQQTKKQIRGQRNIRAQRTTSQIKNQIQAQPQNVKINKKFSSGIERGEKTKKPETDRNWTSKESSTDENQLQSRTVRSKHEPIVIRVKTQDNQSEEKYTFKTDSVVSKQKWEAPVVIKKTGSVLFDNKGKQVKKLQQSLVNSKTKKDEPDLKTKILFVVFLIISLLLILNAMTPSSKRR